MSAPYRLKNLPFLSIDTTDGKGKDLLQDAERRLGFLPNGYGGMVNVPALFESYVTTYKLMRSECGFTSVEQEVVFLAISHENDCDYCMAAHSFIADEMSDVPSEVTDAMRENRQIPDPKLDVLANFSRTMMRSRGRPSEAEAEAFLAAGFEEKHMLGIILAIGCKAFSNYTNRLFDTPLDKRFGPRKWSRAD